MGFCLEIITPKGIYSTLEVESLTVKLSSGYRTILKGHTPLIGCLDYAPMHIIKGGEIIHYAVHGGALNVTKDKVTLIVNSIEEASEIDKERAQKSKERAESRLSSKDENIDVKRAQLSLMRAITRLQTIERL